MKFQIDFQSMTVRSVTEARILEDRERRQRRLDEDKLKKIESDINGNMFTDKSYLVSNTIETPR